MVASREISKIFRILNFQKPVGAPSQKDKSDADQGNKKHNGVSPVTLYGKGIRSTEACSYEVCNKMWTYVSYEDISNIVHCFSWLYSRSECSKAREVRLQINYVQLHYKWASPWTSFHDFDWDLKAHCPAWDNFWQPKALKWWKTLFITGVSVPRPSTLTPSALDLQNSARLNTIFHLILR